MWRTAGPKAEAAAKLAEREKRIKKSKHLVDKIRSDLSESDLICQRKN